ncbi:MAG: PIN domain-containing protein [Candidatus Solibacter usitatus]|nr:PIN domain-containing protein [Candidatus Solibacter usitatus]
MNSAVVDTDVVSLVFKGDSRAEKYLSVLTAPDLLVSFMTEAELERWILQSRWGPERIIRFRTYMKRFVSVPSSRDLIVKWAQVMVVARSMGRRIEVADAWVAATALLYDAPLVTNNPGDYAGVAGIKLLPTE